MIEMPVVKSAATFHFVLFGNPPANINNSNQFPRGNDLPPVIEPLFELQSLADGL